jgi:hypothetical protein
MSGFKDRTKRFLIATVAAAGAVTFAPDVAGAYDRGHCDWLFGAANVLKATTFSINAGKVDFGDGLHFAGAPRGTAMVCWANDGRVAIAGRVYADSIR